MMWVRRQKEAMTRLPIWAQVVDARGESVSDGSLRMARLQRLREAIIAADEAAFLELGEDADTSEFVNSLEIAPLAMFAGSRMVSEEKILEQLAEYLGPEFPQLSYDLAMAPPRARSDFFEIMRYAVKAVVAQTKPRKLTTQESVELIMLTARQMLMVQFHRVVRNYIQAHRVVHEEPDVLEGLPPRKQAKIRKAAACVTMVPREVRAVEEDGTLKTVTKTLPELNDETMKRLNSEMAKEELKIVRQLAEYVTLGSDPSFYAAELVMQSKRVRGILANRIALLKRIQAQTAKEEGDRAAKGVAVGADAAKLLAEAEAQLKDGIFIEKEAAKLMQSMHERVTTVGGESQELYMDKSLVRKIINAWTGEFAPKEVAGTGIQVLIDLIEAERA